MACCADDDCGSSRGQPEGWYRRVLWVALVLNCAMVVTEIVAGLTAGSAALQADAVDFLSDAANYGISLSVIGLGLVWRARAALLKGGSMGLLGLWVAGNTLWHALTGGPPRAEIMGVVSVLALLVNGGVALLLYRYRGGDANMRSVWICSRDDAVGNIAVMLAALGVFGTSTAWPDIVVASIMAAMSLWGASPIVTHAWNELKTGEKRLFASVTVE